MLAEGIPDKLGYKWRVLHPFEIPGVRFPTDNTPPNQRRLAENDALVDLIQTAEYLKDTPTWGQRDYRPYPTRYSDPFYRCDTHEIQVKPGNFIGLSYVGQSDLHITYYGLPHVWYTPGGSGCRVYYLTSKESNCT